MAPVHTKTYDLKEDLMTLDPQAEAFLENLAAQQLCYGPVTRQGHTKVTAERLAHPLQILDWERVVEAEALAQRIPLLLGHSISGVRHKQFTRVVVELHENEDCDRGSDDRYER